MLEIVAIALLAIGVVLAAAALVRAIGGVRIRASADAGRAPDAAILRTASAELDEVQRRSGIEGWTPQLVQRALAAIRIVAASSRGARLSQRIVDRSREPGAGSPSEAGGREPGVEAADVGNRLDGRLLVTHGWLKRVTFAVSSAETTARDGALAAALGKLTAAAYGSNATPDRAALDDAVAGAAEAARRLVRERTGPAAWMRARLAERRG
jgi:hypothetical protein